LLALGVYTVNAKMKAAVAEKTQTDAAWMLDEDDPTNPESYVEVPLVTQDDCEKANETICVVLAPADAEGKPDFEAVLDLESALSSGQQHPNIIRGPYTPQ
ncbi:hypothetical protein ACQZFR_18880, partial [Alcaligenes nematophilus]|uniref:hypothetical protein n=1 Tax=Alcaligenes nematophilus TaxID=2994643 RepID=UPI003D1D1737